MSLKPSQKVVYIRPSFKKYSNLFGITILVEDNYSDEKEYNPDTYEAKIAISWTRETDLFNKLTGRAACQSILDRHQETGKDSPRLITMNHDQINEIWFRLLSESCSQEAEFENLEEGEECTANPFNMFPKYLKHMLLQCSKSVPDRKKLGNIINFVFEPMVSKNVQLYEENDSYTIKYILQKDAVECLEDFQDLVS